MSNINQSPQRPGLYKGEKPRAEYMAAMDYIDALESLMRENGWTVGHLFKENPDHPDDGACVFQEDDFDGTICDGLRDDHVANALEDAR